MKRYLALVGNYYYPTKGTADWLGVFASELEAQMAIDIAVAGKSYCWSEVVDLWEWTQ